MEKREKREKWKWLKWKWLRSQVFRLVSQKREKREKWLRRVASRVAMAFSFVLAFVVFVVWINKSKPQDKKIMQAFPQEAAVQIQIYPNYNFPDGVSQIRVPLIPINQKLSRQAGGWVITPAGSEYRIDYNVPIVIEYIDGRKFARQPNQPTYDGIRPSNSIFRLYGEAGECACITIKRGVY